ncbi:Chitinase [uncultured Candidatus Thioglobus sp.]|nr:Chitinase [uncultured Candidatus Thioglobus sp.]
MNNGEDKEKLTNVSQWGTADWTSMESAFQGATVMTMSADDVPVLLRVKNMRFMFHTANAFTGNSRMNDWNVSGVTNMQSMFASSTVFNQDIGDWDTSSVTLMGSMFFNAKVFNQNISGWDVSSITGTTGMVDMFLFAAAFNQNLGAWYVTSPTSLSLTPTITAQNGVLRAQGKTYELVAGANDSDLFTLANTSTGATLTPVNSAQAYATYTITVTVTAPFGTNNQASATINYGMPPAVNGLTSFNTVWNIPADDLDLTFPGVGSYTINWGDNTPIQNANGTINHTFPTGGGEFIVKVSNAITGFNLNNHADAPKLTGVSKWGGATWGSDMSGAFYGASALTTINASDKPNFGSVTNMSSMFRDARAFNDNINSWDVSSVTNMDNMFRNATVFNGNISDWNVSSVNTMIATFSAARAFNANIGGWDVSSVTDMNSMLGGAENFNKDISGWDVSNVMNMNGMLGGALIFNQDISGWNLASATSMTTMFGNVGNSTAFNGNLGRWYVTDRVASTTPTLTAQNTAQNSALNGQNLSYTFVTGNGDTDNDLFRITSANALALRTTDPTTKTYSLRIGITGTGTPWLHWFGTNNEVAIELTSSGIAPATRLYAITVLENTGLSAEAQATVLNAVLPQLLRASTKIAVNNISNRIDQALDAPASASASASFNIDGSSSFQQLINSSVRSAALKNKPDLRQLFNNASFLVPLNLSGEGYGGASNMTLWGSGNYLNFEDNTSGVDSTGKVVGASIGIDTRLEKDLVAGAALSYSQGEADYTNAGANGTLINTLTSIHPYVGYQLPEGGRVWGTLGYGQGEVEISKKDNPDDIRKRDTELVSLAFGANRELSSSADWLDRPGTTTLRLKGEVSLSNIEVGEDTTVNAPALSIDANRYRIALEASHKEMLANGASFNPSLELGLRYDDDGGNNSNSSGGGIELAANYRYNNPNGLDVELQVHGLLAHESDYKEWGVSGVVKYQANNSGQGLWLSLTPSFGNTPGNVADRTWDNATITDQINGTTNTLRLNTEIGYGLVGFSGLGLLTPYAGLNITNDIHTYNIGTHWAITPATNLTLTAHRQQSANSIKFLGDFKF